MSTPDDSIFAEFRDFADGEADRLARLEKLLVVLRKADADGHVDKDAIWHKVEQRLDGSNDQRNDNQRAH